jgi:hypothetical protein
MSSIDVIIPCYRYGHFLRECVQSVLTQEGTTVRVLIIDDASPDDSAIVAAQLAKEDSRVTFFRHVENKGHIATYNEGIEWLSAKYMLLLSADDYLLPGALSRATRLMEDHPEIGFTFGNSLELNETGAKIPTNAFAHSNDQSALRILSGPDFIELCSATNIVPTPTAVVRTELQKRVGGYRPELPHSGDLEMWFRLAARASVGFVREYQAVYRRHSANMSSAYSRTWLPDVQQRKLALDYFFGENGSGLAGGPRLRRKAYASLGRESLTFASWAFNLSEVETTQRLIDFAAQVWPETKQSWQWTKLRCKQLMGIPAWNAFQTFAGSARSRGK